MNRPLTKPHSMMQIPLFDRLSAKVFNHVLTHGLEMYRKICLKIAHFYHQIWFCKRSNDAACENEREDKVVISQEEQEAIRFQGVPSHVAIVMDGNRRWAKNRDLPPIMGHWQGAQVLTQITEFAVEIGIRVLTVYSFSTENWSRPQEEIDGLMTLFQVYLKQERERMQEQGVRLCTIGDLSRLPKAVQEEISISKEKTAGGKKIDLVLAINYGGRDDLRRACVRIAQQIEKGALKQGEITEEVIASFLDTASWRDPDLLIRTSGEMRQSNFLLWQLAYTELDYSQVLWPDFTERDFLTSIRHWQDRKRRLGK